MLAIRCSEVFSPHLLHQFPFSSLWDVNCCNGQCESQITPSLPQNDISPLPHDLYTHHHRQDHVCVCLDRAVLVFNCLHRSVLGLKCLDRIVFYLTRQDHMCVCLDSIVFVVFSKTSFPNVCWKDFGGKVCITIAPSLHVMPLGNFVFISYLLSALPAVTYT